MRRDVTIIWGGMLAATYLGVVPVAVILLQRALRAAQNIEYYTAEMLSSGVGVATNTANVAALKDTIAVAPQLVGEVESLEHYTATIATALGANPSQNGQDQEVEA